MLPGTVKADRQVEINDSCNNCCCFGWKHKKKNDGTLVKVRRQSPVFDMRRDDHSPRRVERNVTRIQLDATMIDDVEIVQDYKVKE